MSCRCPTRPRCSITSPPTSKVGGLPEIIEDGVLLQDLVGIFSVSDEHPQADLYAVSDEHSAAYKYSVSYGYALSDRYPEAYKYPVPDCHSVPPECYEYAVQGISDDYTDSDCYTRSH